MLVIRISALLKTTLAAILTFCVWNSYGQQYLDEKCFLADSTPGSLRQKLLTGYRVLFLNKSRLSAKEIDWIAHFLDSKSDPLILIFNSVDPDNLSRLSNYIYEGPPDDRVFGPEFHKGRLYIFSYDGNFLNASKYLKEPVSGDRHCTNNLTMFKDDPGLSVRDLKDQLRNLYHNTGNLPNIFVSHRPETVKPIIDSINSQVYYNAIVIEDGVKLSQVSWDTTQLTSSGKIHTQVTRVRPYKRGYMFSPDVINFNEQNASSIKVFRAHKRRLDDALRLNLNFEQNPDNSTEQSLPYRYANITYVKDPERGWVGEFSGKEKYIDFGSVLGNIESEVTISVWVYPYELSYNKSIVGVGESFSAKILNGNLVFTTPDIRDHINESDSIPKDSWSHISFVYDTNQFVYFYVNGQRTNTLPASGIRPTSQSLIIGTNLWDEFFVGRMDNLKIWTRALSDDEIRLVFEEGGDVQAESTNNYWLFAMAIFIFPLLLVWWKLNGKKAKASGQAVNSKMPVLQKSGDPSYFIRVFDHFQLKNQRDVDLTNQLSPQRKELFLLILIYTVRKGGIETREMTDILWAGYSAESAKNNRSTQMVRLREILAKDTGVTLVYEDKLWKIRFESAASCDLASYQAFKNQLPPHTLAEPRLVELLKMVGNGSLLPKLDYEWLDLFKGEISNEILEMLTPCFYSDECLSNQKLMLRLTKAFTTLDPLNEQALNYQLNVYLKEGKHALARHTFESYRKTYFNFYNESFSKNFTEYISGSAQLRHL